METRRRVNAAQTAVIDFRHNLSNQFTAERAPIQSVVTEHPDVAAYIAGLERQIIESECQTLMDKLLNPDTKSVEPSKITELVKEYGAANTTSIGNMIQDMDNLIDSLSTLRANSVQLVNTVSSLCDKN
jgi:phosphopentomutase